MSSKKHRVRRIMGLAVAVAGAGVIAGLAKASQKASSEHRRLDNREPLWSTTARRPRRRDQYVSPS